MSAAICRKRDEITRYALKTPIYAACIEKFFGICYNASVDGRAETTAEHPLSQGAKCAFTYRSLALPTASGKGADAEQMRLPLSERAQADSTDPTAAAQITDRTALRRASYIPFIAWRCDSSPGLRIAFFLPSAATRGGHDADALPNAPCRCDSAPAAPRKSDMPRAFSDAPRRADVRFRTCRPLLTQKAICRYVPGRPARVRSHALPACADPRRICAYVQTTARRGISANGRAHSVIPSVAAPRGHDITETS